MRWAALLAAFLLPVAAGSALRRFRRFAIAGSSMAPAYRHGDFVVADMQAYRSAHPRPGEVVVALDPRERSRTLVKRVACYEPAAGAWLLGDNPAGSTDSRAFGSVDPDHILGRVLFRYWPPRRRDERAPADTKDRS